MPSRTEITVPISSIVYDESLYPRKEHDPALVQRYVEQIEGIEAAKAYLVVSGDMRLLDGKHRWLAYRTLHNDDQSKEITVYQEDITSEREMFHRAVQLNSAHGYQLTPADKKQSAIRLYGEGTPVRSIAELLSVANGTVTAWLERTVKEEKSKEKAIVRDMWQRCYTYQEIADELGQSMQKIASISKISAEGFYGNTSAYDADYKPAIYNIWKKQEKTNRVSHFGNSEVEWLENLVYMYTNPGQIIIDPFAGGASTLDVARKRYRRCWISDRKPIVAREKEIRKHDLVTDGIPDLTGRWKDVGLVYLDPPYWKQAEGKYSDDPTDLANMELEEFHSAMARIINGFASKAKNARIAMIIQPTQWKAPDRKYIDHVVEIIKRVKASVEMRISVPYESQQYNAQMVDWAKANKTVLVLTREIVVWDVRDAT